MPRTERTCTSTRATIKRRVSTKRLLAAFSAAWLATATSAGAQPAKPIGDERLGALAQRYFSEVWRLDPVEATAVGIHTGDDRLGTFTAEGYRERVELARRTFEELKAIDTETMGAEAADDAQILASRLQSTVLDLGTLESWKHRPAAYVRLASRGVDVLLAGDFAPLATRARSIVAREEEIPALLDAAKENVTTVDATTADVTRSDIADAIAFFSTAVPQALAPVKDPALTAAFKAANSATLEALRGYGRALDAGPFAHPSGTFAVGSATYAEELRLRELAPIPLDRYEAAGVDALAKTAARFVETARLIDPARSPGEVAVSLRAAHPTADGLLLKAKNDLQLLRVFVVTHRIVSVPPEDDVAVVATPEFARGTTAVAMLHAPGPLEAAAAHVSYDVTPVEPGWSAERREQHLASFDDAAFPLASAREVMPGRYLDLALARHEKLSLIRKLSPSASFADGWADYDVQMIVDEGWGNGDPRVRLAQLQADLERECRYLVGLREHTQNMGVDAATAFFEKNAFMAAEPARREALRGTQEPFYGDDALGKLEIQKLRDDFKKAAGSRYSLEAFHDALLAHGDPPIAIARKIVLGADDDGKLF